MGQAGTWVAHAHADRRAGRVTLRRVIVENGLSLTLGALFVIALVGQAWAGYHVYNEEQLEHGAETVSFAGYLGTGHFLEATAENWESEFLQMGAFVWLTSFLFQKGSPESKDPYDPSEDRRPVTARSPWPARRGGAWRKLYEYSLSIVFLLLFLGSFALHVAAGAVEHSAEQLQHGEPAVAWWQYLRTSQLWFESFQNWQSEFLAIAAMVLLSIFLRQQGSPESKPVQTPHAYNE